MLAVTSEIGRLRRVLVHRPGREIRQMVPELMEHLLFDDLLDQEVAQAEHDTFRTVLEGAGVEVLDAQDLLAEVLEADDLRAGLIEALARRHALEPEIVSRLEGMTPVELSLVLLAGLRTDDPARERRRQFFHWSPVPNYFFQRDPQFVLGDRAVVASMATEAREREPVLARAIFEHHPSLAGAVPPVSLASHVFGGPDYDPESIVPTIEGGDVLVPTPELLLVGLSERTNRRGVERLAEYLRSSDSSFRRLILVELPAKRSFMHLDTVFTFVDHDVCLGHLPVIEPERAQSAHAYLVDLTAEQLSFQLCASLLEALARAGLEVDVIPCGGEDRIFQEREQWTDGANAFALEPGVIVLYERNRQTTDELARRGWRVLTEGDVLAGAEVVGQGPTAVTFRGHELSRARGGPRCMTMPLERDAL